MSRDSTTGKYRNTSNPNGQENVGFLPIWKPNFIVDDTGRVNFGMICLGKRRSGKSQMVKYLYETYLINKYDLVLIYTTEVNAEFYKKFIIGRKYIVTNGDLTKVKKVSSVNTKRKKSGKSPINVLCVFDDTNSRREKFNNDILDIYTKGRHVNISSIYNAQAATLTDNIWRENTDYMLIWRQKRRTFQEYVAENVLAGYLEKDFPSKTKERNHYIALLKKNTFQKYWALVVDDPSENLFRFKAPI